MLKWESLFITACRKNRHAALHRVFIKILFFSICVMHRNNDFLSVLCCRCTTGRCLTVILDQSHLQLKTHRGACDPRIKRAHFGPCLLSVNLAWPLTIEKGSTRLNHTGRQDWGFSRVKAMFGVIRGSVSVPFLFVHVHSVTLPYQKLDSSFSVSLKWDFFDRIFGWNSRFSLDRETLPQRISCLREKNRDTSLPNWGIQKAGVYEGNSGSFIQSGC